MKTKRVLCALTILALCLSLLTIVPAFADNAQGLSMLHTEGNRIVTENGEQITLRGTNLGGWLMQEGWLSPLGSGEIDHSYIVNVTASCSNGNHTPNFAVDTVYTAGIITNNVDTYWQSDKAQANDNMEIKKNLANSTVSTLSNIQRNWNIPLLVGEFCLYYFNDVWDDFLSDLNENHISWTNWCYKVRGTKFESGGGNWGYFNTFSGAEPDLMFDSFEQIHDKWACTGTSGYFTENLPLTRIVAARADGSTNYPYVALNRTGWIVTATNSSVDPWNPVSNMLDGDISTRWSSGIGQAAGQSIMIDMQQSENFDKIEMLCDGQDFPGFYKVEISQDGTQYTLLELNNVDIGFGSKMVLLPANPQTARYVRITLTGAKPENW